MPNNAQCLLCSLVAPFESCRNQQVERGFFMQDFEKFIVAYDIAVDSYSGIIGNMDFGAIIKAYSESKWLRDNIKALSKVCRNYLKIISGTYKDTETKKEEKLYDFKELEQ